MLAADVVKMARTLLNDVDGVRWPDGEMLGWVNNAQLQIVTMRPDVTATVKDVALDDGIEQRIPADGLKLLDIIQNTDGRAITLVARSDLTAFNPGWTTARPADVVQHFMFDIANPKVFHVYPPAGFNAEVRMVYSALPKACVTLADRIAFDDTYASAMVDWVCYRAWTKDGDSAADAARAGNALNAFTQALGAKTSMDAEAQPMRK